MKNINDETIKDLVFKNDYQASNLSADMIRLEVIQGAVEQLMERIDEMTHKNWDEKPAMARLAIHEISNTVRLIDMGFNPLFTTLSESVNNLETQSKELFDIVVEQKNDDKKA